MPGKPGSRRGRYQEREETKRLDADEWSDADRAHMTSLVDRSTLVEPEARTFAATQATILWRLLRALDGRPRTVEEQGQSVSASAAYMRWLAFMGVDSKAERKRGPLFTMPSPTSLPPSSSPSVETKDKPNG